MILFISDIHGWYSLVNDQIRHAETTFGRQVATVIALGDFGLFGPALHDYFAHHGGRFLRPFCFVEGNHEDFSHFDSLCNIYRSHLTHLPRGSITLIDGLKILGFGGAAYMDPRLTPHGSEIRDEDIDRCLSLPDATVDIVVSHDCPKGLGVPDSPRFRHFGPTGFDRGFEISRRFRPAIWVFGHHHQWFQAEREETRFEGLAESWHGYAVYHREFGFRRVEHFIKRHRGFWQNLFPGLFG